MNIQGIYAIKNLNTGKAYVGSAINIKYRWIGINTIIFQYGLSIFFDPKTIGLFQPHHIFHIRKVGF